MYELASCERRMHEGCALGRGEVARISSRAVENSGKRRVVHLEDARAGVTREVDLGAVPISATQRESSVQRSAQASGSWRGCGARSPGTKPSHLANAA